MGAYNFAVLLFFARKTIFGYADLKFYLTEAYAKINLHKYASRFLVSNLNLQAFFGPVYTASNQGRNQGRG